MKTRIRITVEGTTLHYLTTEQKKQMDISLGMVVDALVLQIKDRERDNNLAKLIADQVVLELKSQGCP